MPELGAIVAERYFEARKGDAEEYEVILRIGAPVRDSRPEGDWYCPYQILGVQQSRISEAYGVDALQALLLALEKAKSELAFSARVNGFRLTWLDQEDWGLP